MSIGDTRGTTPTDGNTTPNVDEIKVKNSSSGSDTSVGEYSGAVQAETASLFDIFTADRACL